MLRFLLELVALATFALWGFASGERAAIRRGGAPSTAGPAARSALDPAAVAHRRRRIDGGASTGERSGDKRLRAWTTRSVRVRGGGERTGTAVHPRGQRCTAPGERPSA
ncbi:DUF2568 domain-containing protein [Rathayibacter sp. AY1E5]|uniref:DUF2568 domain-containing protein n=1 Tax=Rathayibacter sp. AY1E5 TaxID=2080553 RepID=UPI0035BE1067